MTLSEHDHDWGIVDVTRSACLCDVGAPGRAAVTVVNADGTTHLVLAQRDSINDETEKYNASCNNVEHEQLGPLPLEFTRRITISRRTFRCGPDAYHYCGRPTKTGRPCRARVLFLGDACAWHQPEDGQR